MGITRENIFTINQSWIHVYTITSQSTSFSVVNTPTRLIRATGLTTEVVRNVSVDEDGIFTIKNGGLYLANLSCTFSGATNDNMRIQIYKNGTALNVGRISWNQKGGNKWEVSTCILQELNGNDTIDVYIENQTDTTSISLLNYNMNLIKLY